MIVDIYTTSKKYNIIYADPPWQYKAKGSKNYKYGMAERYYSTMSVEELMALPIKKLKSDEALLFMWATFPCLEEAIAVMKAWGFEYKTLAFCWIKTDKKGTPSWGMGNYTRSNAEVCLLGVSKKSKAQKLVRAHNIHSTIISPRLRHSEKPLEVQHRIEELLLPTEKKIELFARCESKGWDCWGNEVGEK